MASFCAVLYADRIHGWLFAAHVQIVHVFSHLFDGMKEWVCGDSISHASAYLARKSCGHLCSKNHTAANSWMIWSVI